MIDMTSFDFAVSCGPCHPGGGPLELDREGHRYDEYMRQHDMTPGGDNGLDGDYFRALWSKSGVVEADCLLCHLPEYLHAERAEHLSALNFRWAAVAGSGLAKVTGSVKQGTPVHVAYDMSRFASDGRLSLHVVREPRNDTCLKCHGKSDWKKRGASYSPRTDVHIRAGLRCIDCHPAGSAAVDERIDGEEVHQFGKGDDPGGHVRDDLDNTMRDCADCHSDGYLGAPIAEHRGLPPLHLEKLACQTCHIPKRYVKAALVEVNDVFNPGPKISPPAKHIWTFYDADMRYWNHYGEVNMFTRDDQPVTPYRPVLGKYRDKIYPMNRVHSAWPGLKVDGKSGLDHLFMKDVFMMWQTHSKDPSKYDELREIRDDNGDGIPEVNRPAEIDAFIASVQAYLRDTHFDLTGKQVVWVSDDRVYSSGTDFEILPKHDYEATPYASVFKYNHDVAPAGAALGAKGCQDCHSRKADVFFGSVVRYPFGDDANPVTQPQHSLLGLSASAASLSAFREGPMKAALYGVAFVALCMLAGTVVSCLGVPTGRALRSAGWIVSLGGVVCGLLILRRTDLRDFAFPSRESLDGHHSLLAAAVVIAGVMALAWALRPSSDGRPQHRTLAAYLSVVLGLSVVCGLLMMTDVPWLADLTRLAYAGLDGGLIAILAGVLVGLALTMTEPDKRAARGTRPRAE